MSKLSPTAHWVQLVLSFLTDSKTRLLDLENKPDFLP